MCWEVLILVEKFHIFGTKMWDDGGYKDHEMDLLIRMTIIKPCLPSENCSIQVVVLKLFCHQHPQKQHLKGACRIVFLKINAWKWVNDLMVLKLIPSSNIKQKQCSGIKIILAVAFCCNHLKFAILYKVSYMIDQCWYNCSHYIHS